jgi:signal transduction histidine kinase
MSTRSRVLVWTLAGVAAVELAFIVVGAWLAGPADLVESYTLTNTAFGIGFGGCGLVIAVKRPQNPIGWLFLTGAVAHLTTAATAPWGFYGVDQGWPEPGVRLLATVFLAAWPLGVGMAFPMALLLFPTGRVPSPGWRWMVYVVVAHGVLFTLWMGTEPNAGVEAGAQSYLALPFYDALDPLWQVVTVAGLPMLTLIAASLVVRYRRGDEKERRQLLWLVLAVGVALVANLQRYVTGEGPILLLLSFQLVPLAVAIAIVRYQLFDIRLVVARAVLYAVLTAAVVAVYVTLVTGLDGLLRRQAGVGSSVLATIAVAVAFNPVRVRLQRIIDRLFYGDRTDPVRAMTHVGQRLAAGDERAMLEALRDSLRLPYAEIRADGRATVSGTPAGEVHVVPLRLADDLVGELVVGARTGEARLSAADLRVLELLAMPLATALRSASLAEEVKDSRERIVAGREEERRRLRRDLHDGIGPTLTGVAYTLDAVRNTVKESPEKADAVLAELRTAVAGAIDDVRRVVYGLRPPSLDEVGLADALRQQASRFALRRDGAALVVTIDAPEELPELPAAVEVAAYRIAVEGLTNVARHSTAGTAQVRLAVTDGALRVEVLDDGTSEGAWHPGVGLAAMAERAAEVGGVCEAGPAPRGGRVSALLPLAGVRA